VREELEWDPDLDATDIAVSVKKAWITLAGFARSYARQVRPRPRQNAWLACPGSRMMSKLAYPAWMNDWSQSRA
jgi:hypothetical protein